METRRHNKHYKSKQILSVKAIQDFQQAYYLEFGVHLTSQQAQTNGLRLLQFMKHILKPIPINIDRKKYGK